MLVGDFLFRDMAKGFKIKTTTKRAKYGNTKVEAFGIKFDSTREYRRYLALKEAQDKGLISDLEVHKKFTLIPPVVETIEVQLKTKTKMVEKVVQKAITYTADFVYTKDGQEVIEDVKISEYMLPKEYLLKEKLFFYNFRKRIKRVYKPTEEI